MKIIIPTNDGLSISPDFESTSSYRFLKVVNGVVLEDTVEPVGSNHNSLLALGNNDRDPLYHQTLITREILPETERDLLRLEYEVVHTRETNIINAVMFYLKNLATMESNYCCCR